MTHEDEELIQKSMVVKMDRRHPDPEKEISIKLGDIYYLNSELTHMRLTLEIVGAGLGKILEKGVHPKLHDDLLELYVQIMEDRREIAHNRPEVAAIVENIINKYADNPEALERIRKKY